MIQIARRLSAETIQFSYSGDAGGDGGEDEIAELELAGKVRKVVEIRQIFDEGRDLSGDDQEEKEGDDTEKAVKRGESAQNQIAGNRRSASQLAMHLMK